MRYIIIFMYYIILGIKIIFILFPISYCFTVPQCELITPIVPVTSETWSLSFAMFLHLLLHENKLTRRGSDRFVNNEIKK